MSERFFLQAKGSILGIPHKQDLCLLVLFLVAEFLIFNQYGVRSSWDTAAYLENAKNILRGQGIAKEYAGYSSYIMYLATQLFVGGNDFSMALGQVFLAGISVLAFYKIATRYLSPNFCLYATVCFAIWPSVRYWDSYLYTESFYVSFLVLSLYAAILAREGRVSWFWLFLLLLITSFIRPPALLFTLSLLLAFAAYSIRTRTLSQKKILLFGLAAVFTMSYTLFLFGTEHASQLSSSYVKGEVIYPNVCIPSPLEAASTPTLSHLTLNHPFWMIKLVSLKLWYFLSGTKPFYSPLHNTMAIITNSLLYLLAVLSLWSGKWKKEEPILIFTFFLANMLMVAITAENWDGRFHLPLIPFLLVLAFNELERFLSVLANKNTRFR